VGILPPGTGSLIAALGMPLPVVDASTIPRVGISLAIPPLIAGIGVGIGMSALVLSLGGADVDFASLAFAAPGICAPARGSGMPRDGAPFGSSFLFVM